MFIRSIPCGDEDAVRSSISHAPKVNPESRGAHSLLGYAVRSLTDEPDFFYRQQHFPSDVEVASCTPGLLAGLRPVQRLRLAAIDAQVRQAYMGNMPPEITESLEHGNLGAVLSTAPARVTALSAAQSAIVNELSLVLEYQSTPARSGLIEVQNAVEARLPGWKLLAARAELSLPELLQVETPHNMALLLAYDKTFRQTFRDTIARPPELASVESNFYETLQAGANTLVSVLHSLQPMWDRPAQPMASGLADKSLAFLHDILVDLREHGTCFSAQEEERERITSDLIVRFSAFIDEITESGGLGRIFSDQARAQIGDGNLNLVEMQHVIFDFSLAMARVNNGPEVVFFCLEAMAPEYKALGRMQHELSATKILREACDCWLQAKQVSESEAGRGRIARIRLMQSDLQNSEALKRLTALRLTTRFFGNINALAEATGIQQDTIMACFLDRLSHNDFSVYPLGAVT